MGARSANELTVRGALGRGLLFLALATLFTTAVAALVPAGIVGGGVALLVGSGAAALVLLRRDDRPWAELGLRLDRAAPGAVLGGLSIGFGAAATALAATALVGGVRWTADGGTLAAWLTGGVWWLAVLAVPALAEEVALRGYLLRIAARGFGPLPALVGTSVLFGLLHVGNPAAGVGGIAGTTAAGLLLGALVLRTGSLWWAAGAHLGWNWALLWPADLPVSGLELADAPWVDGSTTGAAWMGGGAFGPEAGVPAILALSGLAVWVWRSERLGTRETTNETKEGRTT